MNLTLSMPKQYIEKLNKEHEETGLSNSEIVRRAIDVYLESKKESVR